MKIGAILKSLNAAALAATKVKHNSRISVLIGDNHHIGGGLIFLAAPVTELLSVQDTSQSDFRHVQGDIFKLREVSQKPKRWIWRSERQRRKCCYEGKDKNDAPHRPNEKWAE